MFLELYRDWLIELNLGPEGYAFRCRLAQDNLFVNSEVFYFTPEAALEAAHSAADLESARLAAQRCYDFYRSGELTIDEYELIERLIMQAI